MAKKIEKNSDLIPDAKITLIETHCGLKIVIRGSANLCSAKCIEHLEIQENP